MPRSTEAVLKAHGGLTPYKDFFLDFSFTSFTHHYLFSIRLYVISKNVSCCVLSVLHDLQSMLSFVGVLFYSYDIHIKYCNICFFDLISAKPHVFSEVADCSIFLCSCLFPPL